VGLERGPLNLVSITEEILEWKSSGSGYRKPRLTAEGIRCADHATPQKLTLTSPRSGGRSVGVVRLRTKATESVYSDINMDEIRKITKSSGPLEAKVLTSQR
jgi:hypothetical protein